MSKDRKVGAFDALADDDSDGEEDIQEDPAAEATFPVADKIITSEDDESGWQLVGKSLEEIRNADPKTNQDDLDLCLICQRGFSAKYRDMELPCSAKCNVEVSVHKKCLNRWRVKSDSCPLCRAALNPPISTSTIQAVTYGSSSCRTEDRATAVTEDRAASATEDGDISSFVFIELDSKSLRSNHTRRVGKANTFKAAQQRKYSIAKRDQQRSAAKAGRGVTFVDDGDDGDDY